MTMQYMQLDSVVVVAAKYHHPSDRSLTEDDVFLAVAHAVKTHAALSSRILNERGPHPQYARMSKLRLDEAIYFLGEDDARGIAEIMHDEFLKPIDTSKDLPLWRVTVSSDNHIFYSWHHAIGDGNSGPIVLRTILEGLNLSTQGSSDDKPARVIEPNTNLKLTPAMDELTDLSISFKQFLEGVKETVIPTSWWLRKTWTGGKIVPSAPTPAKNRIRIIAIDADTAARLLMSARKHSTTLTAVLYILALNVITNLLPKHFPKKKYKRIAGVIPVSYAKFVQLPPDVIVDAVSVYTSYDKLDPNFSWEKAATFSTRLHKEIPRLREVVGTLKFLFGQFERYFKDQLGGKRHAGLLISNLGAFKAEKDDNNERWRIEDMYFSQDDRYIGAALKMNVIGSPNGRVNNCLTWCEGIVSNEFAESFAKGLEKSIVELSQQD